MTTPRTKAIAVALQFLAVPAMAQGTFDKESNAHHYQGDRKQSCLIRTSTPAVECQSESLGHFR